MFLRAMVDRDTFFILITTFFNLLDIDGTARENAKHHWPQFKQSKLQQTHTYLANTLSTLLPNCFFGNR